MSAWSVWGKEIHTLLGMRLRWKARDWEDNSMALGSIKQAGTEEGILPVESGKNMRRPKTSSPS